MFLFPLRARHVAALSVVAGGAVVAASFVTPCRAEAQPAETRVFRLPAPGMVSLWGRAADRAVLGITMPEGSRADTAGIRIEAVESEGPAAKAGLKAGDVITEINGVSLKVARADAEDLALAGLAQRRLQRVMAKAKPGDDVSLRVQSGSATRSLTVKTVSAADLDKSIEPVMPRGSVRSRTPSGDGIARTERGMVGISIGGAGNARDTLGLFVNSVVTGGPAEKAGIVEGERIAAVNGVDVRLPKEDIEDPQALSARVDRFVREVQKAEPGKAVSLRVYGGGRYREVSVTAVKASELPSEGFSMTMGDGNVRVISPRTPRMPNAPQLFRFDGNRGNSRVRINGRDVEIDGQELERYMEDLGRQLRDSFRGMELDVQGSGGRVRMTPRRSS